MNSDVDSCKIIHSKKKPARLSDRVLQTRHVVLALLANFVVCFCVITVFLKIGGTTSTDRSHHILPFVDAIEYMCGAWYLLFRELVPFLWSPSKFLLLSELGVLALIAIILGLAGSLGIVLALRRDSKRWVWGANGAIAAALLLGTLVYYVGTNIP